MGSEHVPRFQAYQVEDAWAQNMFLDCRPTRGRHMGSEHVSRFQAYQGETHGLKTRFQIPGLPGGDTGFRTHFQVPGLPRD